MTAMRFGTIVVVTAAALALAACESAPKSELAATATPAAAKPDDRKSDAASEAKSDPGPPLERHEAAGQCWMLADKRGGTLEAKANMVEKCIDDKLKADAAKRAAAH